MTITDADATDSVASIAGVDITGIVRTKEEGHGGASDSGGYSGSDRHYSRRDDSSEADTPPSGMA